MLFGGSRSGKTFLILRAQMTRALAYESRHAVLRYRFNHLKASVIYDTLPKMTELCWPGLWAECKLDKTDWFLKLPNGSEFWFGGLDDKERTEKILGNEYADIFFNECSQIPWASRETAITRLAQKTPLRLKAYYDCNPPDDAHWTAKMFVDKQAPDTRAPLNRPENYAALQMNPADNLENLAEGYMDELDNLSAAKRARFRDGLFSKSNADALWNVAMIDRARYVGALPEMIRIVVAVDPSGCSGDEDKRSDEIGIVVVGLGIDGRGYVLEDASGRYGPEGWGNIAVSCYDRYEADAIVGEINYGGAMVGQVIRAVRKGIPFREVHASRGKAVRAEPVSVLFEKDEFRMAGEFPDLEEQMTSMTTHGYKGSKSPDRLDAMVWGASDLFPKLIRSRDKKNRVPRVVGLAGYDVHAH